MPRARTEAMLSGACILTTPFHGADTFIDHGNSGFLVDRDPCAVADLIESLISDPARAIAIGQRGKRTAQQLFAWDRFAAEWKDLLLEAIAQGPHDKSQRNTLQHA
jgi:phosphatidyl-myo-inositol dimannoside synthase